MVDYGRRELQLTQQNVYRLEENVEDLQTEVAVQKKISDRIKSSLDATKGLLDKTIIEVFPLLLHYRIRCNFPPKVSLGACAAARCLIFAG